MIGLCVYCTTDCVMCQGKPTQGRETRDKVTNLPVFRCYSYACLMKTVDATGTVTVMKKSDSRNAWKEKSA